jgi:uncharacterized protein involved in exopolysaccharide biosynthesis
VQSGAISIENQKDLLLRRSSELQAQVTEANAVISEVTARIDQLKDATASMTPTVLAQTRSIPNQYSVERLTTMLTEMKNRRTQLLAKFQPSDRAIIEIQQEIADTVATLEAVRRDPTSEETTALNPLRESLIADLSKARVQLNGLRARRENLAREDTGLWNQTAHLERSTPEYDSLNRRFKAVEGNYQLYQTKSEEARIAEALDQEKITNVSVAQVPVVPAVPSSSSRALLLLVGLCLAGFVSVGTAVAAEFVSGDQSGSDEQSRAAGPLGMLRPQFTQGPAASPSEGVTGTSGFSDDLGRSERPPVWVLSSDGV